MGIRLRNVTYVQLDFCMFLSQ